MRKIKIFLASSNDMKKNRNATEQVIDEMNKSLAKGLDVVLELFRWEKNVIPQMGRPQGIIFEQANFEDLDIFIGILGNRFGTPTGSYDENNVEYGSGTQEEYEMAYKTFIKTGKPHIMIFKDNAPLKQGLFDIDQYAKVQNFIKEFETNKSHPGIYQTFNNVTEFQSHLRISLTMILFKIVGMKKVNNDSELSEKYQNLGFQKMFVPDTNNLRSIEKNKSLSNTSEIKLLAKTGNSFLGNIGNRYRDLLIYNVEYNDARVKILLLNPWSYGAILAAFSESVDEEEYLKYILHSEASQEIVAKYVNTDWYKIKLKDVISGYKELNTKYPAIEMRFIDVEITSSILLTDNDCYIELYSNYCKTDRLRKKVSTFEVKMSNKAELYDASNQYFDLLWNIGITYDTFINNENYYKNRLYNYLDSLNDKNTAYFIGIHAMIRNNDKILLLHRADNKTYMPSKWDIPGGSLMAGEDLESSLEREIKEETGIVVKIGKIVHGFSNKVELPFRQTIQLIYDAEYVSGDVILNPTEHQDYCWVTVDEAKKYNLINFLDNYLNKK